MEKSLIDAKLTEMGITMESVFIPFDKSRNKDEKCRTMNWEVTIKKGTRTVLFTEYSAGAGHCPSYKLPVPAWFTTGSNGRNASYWQHLSSIFETKYGVKYNRFESIGGEHIQPNFVDVMYSLVSDYSVLDYADYESFADSYGYDQDSRKGEEIYKAGVRHGLKLRGSLGEDKMQELQEIFQDY